jgi:hypothetical protein
MPPFMSFLAPSPSNVSCFCRSSIYSACIVHLKKKTSKRLKRSDQIWSSCEWGIFTTRNFTNAEAEFYFQGTSRIISLCRYSYPQSRWSFSHNFASIIPPFRTNYKTSKCNELPIKLTNAILTICTSCNQSMLFFSSILKRKGWWVWPAEAKLF